MPERLQSDGGHFGRGSRLPREIPDPMRSSGLLCLTDQRRGENAETRVGQERPPADHLDHPIRPGQQRGRDRQSERLGALQVDDQLERRRWSTGKSPGLLPLRIFIDEAGGATEVVSQGHSIGQFKPPELHRFPLGTGFRPDIEGNDAWVTEGTACAQSCYFWRRTCTG